MNKLILGILLITIFAIVSITSLSYYIACQPNKASNTPTPTPKPTSSPSEIPSISEQSVPEFTLKFVDNTVQAKIKNNIGASYYNFRFKRSYTNEWRYHPFSPSDSLGYMLPDAFRVPCEASTSDYTVASLPSYFFKDVTEGDGIDVEVQALFGDFRAVPYVNLAPVGGPTYDFYFEGTTSDWSNTQTIKLP